MSLGQNTIAAERLRSFVERVEALRAQKKQLGKDETAVMAEASAEGFSPNAIKYVIKVRAEKPNDRQEREAMQDMYLHAIGLDVEPPLFRFAGLAAIDTSVREQVVERMRDFVPAHGDGFIEVNWHGTTYRLTRGKDGDVTVAEMKEAKKPSRTPREEVPDLPQREPVPETDEAGAEALGRQYAKDNRPVIDNPFPYGDKRRARFDEGWRKQTGGDGMGPDDRD